MLFEKEEFHMSAPNPDKLTAAIQKILASPEATKMLIEQMAETADLHVMRGMSHMKIMDPERSQNALTAIVLDTETTGLDSEKDKVMQLSMLKVLYDDDGIVGITDDFFDQFQDPGEPLDPKIVRLTGITDEMLKGQRINLEEAAEFMKDASLFIAHNAAFDRKFVEKSFPSLGFDKVDWACSIRDVDWDSRVTGSGKLELLLLNQKYVYPAHNAKADCTATGFMLSRSYDGDTPVMSDILKSVSVTPVMVMAIGLPFGNQAPLKDAGWKWSPDRSGDAGDKCWHITVKTPEEALAAAAAAKEAFGGDIALPVRRFSRKNIYSNRLPPVERAIFETKDPLKAIRANDLNISQDEQPSFGF